MCGVSVVCVGAAWVGVLWAVCGWEVCVRVCVWVGGSLVAQMVKRLPTMRETRVRSMGSGRSPGKGNGNPLQYSCLEHPMDGGVW